MEYTMTRINVVPVQELSGKHLVAEYREITRLPNNLKKSLNRKTKPFSVDEIPKEYVLGKGHVKFFYDKMKFLKNRYEQLVQEMLCRGYNPQFTDSSLFEVSSRFFNDYKPTTEAIELNRQRIKKRS
jgi:deoxyribonuclease (pyrimidine dimer)